MVDEYPQYLNAIKKSGEPLLNYFKAHGLVNNDYDKELDAERLQVKQLPGPMAVVYKKMKLASYSKDIEMKVWI